VSSRLLAAAASPTFARHETFHPRYGWLHKGFAAAHNDHGVFTAPNATVTLGVGKNMVNAIRYWAQAFKVLEDIPDPTRPRVSLLRPSPFGEALLSEDGWDPYLEDAGSLWLLHWQLLRPPSLGPAWWVAFNALAPHQFTEAQLVAQVIELASAAGWPAVVEGSVKKDVDCVLRMYAARQRGRQGLDDVLDCPFRELGLVEAVAGEANGWQFVFGEKQNLPDSILAYACLDYAGQVAPEAASISIARLAADPGSPGCAFKLPEAALYDALRRAAAATDELAVVETSGLRQLLFHGAPARLAAKVLETHYRQTTGSTRRWAAAHDKLDLQGAGEQISEQSAHPPPGRAAGPHREMEAEAASTERPQRPGPPEVTAEPPGAQGKRRRPGRRQPSRPLAEALRVRRQFLRSANVERDGGTPDAADYVPTDRALEVLRRIVRAISEPSSSRAWSLTGPYGAGKSSFALFLDALTGPRHDVARLHAEAALALANPELLGALEAGRHAVGADERGFIRAVATAQREPASATVARALRIGAQRYWPTRLPADVAQTIRRLEESPADARLIGALLTCLAGHAPVLLVVDEFGKNLEHFADVGAEADLFVLQELAERASGIHGHPALIVTLQHLALEDYVSKASGVQRREWSKVQGRFEDVPFIESGASTPRLVAAAIDSSNAPVELRKRINVWAEATQITCEELGLRPVLPGGSEALRACYPLHPVTLAALPELCARYGQHGRTLFTFLSSGEPHSLATFLEEANAAGPCLPVVALDRLYDYFLESVGAMVAAANDGTRLLEVATRIREAQGLDPEDARCLKAVGLLNLVSQGGALRASAAMVAFALGSADAEGDDGAEIRGRLRDLERRGFLTYRAFADEYRIWEGTDFDLKAAVIAARERLRSQPPAGLLQRLNPVGPIVAGRHTQRVGMLRCFDAAFADAGTGAVAPPGPKDSADGLVVHFIGDEAEAAQLQVSSGAKPVVIATTPAFPRIAEAAVDVAAVLDVLTQREVQEDRVARRELQERASLGRRRLAQYLAEGFGPSQAGTRWYLAGTGEELDGRQGLSRMLSALCDRIYCDSPQIRNEMLGRRELTSQGAKARRDLLEAMIRHGAKERLGLEGFGPERAMYQATLLHDELHRRSSDGSWLFGKPGSKSTLRPAWRAVNALINEAVEAQLSVDRLYSALMAAPIGMKEGPIPVLVTTVLLHRSDDVALYQEGTYQPRLTPEIVERLVKTPERFFVRRFDTGGSRRTVLEALAEVAGTTRPVRGRNASVLAVAAPLLVLVRSLPEYSKHTKSLSAQAQAVRAALVTAREPDELIFSALPAACGVPPFAPGRQVAPARVARYAARLGAAADELRDAYGALLQTIAAALAAELGLPEGLAALRADLRGRARRLAGQVIDPRLRAFLVRAADEQLDDDDWLEAIALNIADGPPGSWRGDDLERFRIQLHDLAGLLRRVEALHFDAMAAQGEGFEARRVTVTAPDGAETSTVVWVDRSRLESLSSIADEMGGKAQHVAGPQGAEALLAVLAERTRSPNASSAGQTMLLDKRGRASGQPSKERAHG